MPLRTLVIRGAVMPSTDFGYIRYSTVHDRPPSRGGSPSVAANIACVVRHAEVRRRSASNPLLRWGRPYADRALPLPISQHACQVHALLAASIYDQPIELVPLHIRRVLP